MDNFPPSIIRQPPPSLTPAARKEGKINPEIVGDNNLTGVESLPDEVLFDVLVRIPAQDIYDSVRLVCSKWYHMTHTRTFIYTHLRHSTYGLLFESKYDYKDRFLMAVGESGRVEIYNNRYSEIRYPVRSSCNGLLLESEEETVKNVHVSNPTTRQIFTLRPLFGYTLTYPLFAIGYVASSMEYKVVILSMPGQDMEDKCFILTIGVDNSWRTIGKESVSLAATRIFVNETLITEGFVHWFNIYSSKVLTLNVETEIITETSGPTPKGNRLNRYLSTGRYVSLLRPCGEFFWEVWEMKPEIDYQWRKVRDISLEDYKCSTFQGLNSRKVDFLQPIGWLKYLEILVFRILSYTPQSQIFVYYLLTHEIVTIELPAQHSIYDLVVHKDSLVSLGGC